MSAKLRSIAAFGGALLTISCALSAADVPEEAKSSFALGEYPKAIEILNRAAAAFPDDAAVQHLLARSYFENEQFDRAVSAAEKSVALEPKNSIYHEWLGHAFGEKADRSGWFSALSLAKKARKEFETAVQLDPHNYAAMQAMIEFDCSAPGMAGGGEDKARPEIEKLSALDAAEGRYAAGNCRRQKKDFEAADAEFRKALALHPMSAGLIYDMGDYYMKRDQADRLWIVVKEGERADPKDPRGQFYRAVALTIQKERSEECARYFREYVVHSIKRDDFPSKSMAHFWLGRIQENQNDSAGARQEYREAVRLESRNRYAKEALSRVQRD
jgi:tetratricopeptide (TPR) repeat protein